MFKQASKSKSLLSNVKLSRRTKLAMVVFGCPLVMWLMVMTYAVRTSTGEKNELPSPMKIQQHEYQSKITRQTSSIFNVTEFWADHKPKPVQFEWEIEDFELDKPEYLDENGERQTVTVLMWDGMTPFVWAEGDVVSSPNYAGWTIKKPKCPVKCIFTADRQYYHSADALLFDACLTGPTEYREVPIYFPEKREGQMWGWFAYEQQYYFPMMEEKEYMDRFDFKMTYHYDALQQISFTCPWGNIRTFLNPPPPKKKEKLVVFFASNCNTGGATERTAYVKELMKHIRVDSYGSCLHNTDMRPDQHKNGRRSHGDKIIEKIGVISEYKFMLAFENNNKVPDYVTEKMTNAIQAGTVPVYWGSPTVDKWTPGEHSIIKTTDFASPKELAEYLLYLNDHDEQYYEYFAWKKNGLSEQYQKLLDKCLFFAECNLCKKIALTREAPRVPGAPRPLDDAYALRLNCVNCRENRYDQYVEIEHNSALDLVDGFSLVAWVNLNLIQDGRILDKSVAGDPSTGYSWDVLKQPDGAHGVLRLCTGGHCYNSQRKLKVGIWYFVAVTFKNVQDGLKFYVNGNLDSSVTPRSPCTPNTLPLKFGRASRGGGSWRPYHQSSVYDGMLDDISIWNIVLSEKTLKDYMFRRLSGKEKGLVGYWGFNEKPGTMTAFDSSPNQLSARLINNPERVPCLSKPLTDPSNLER